MKMSPAPLIRLAVVGAGARASFVDGDSVELGKYGLEALPDPVRQQFAGGVLKAVDLVEEPMIECLVQRGPGLRNIAVVQEDTLLCIDCASYADINLEGMSVHAATLVAVRKCRQPMSGFKAE